MLKAIGMKDLLYKSREKKNISTKKKEIMES